MPVLTRSLLNTALLGALVLAPQAAAAQSALRAPLSIVPPPMQAALGVASSANDESGKLAPRAAARQMKRAVRAVAATPGKDGDMVQVGQLGTLEDAPVGLEPGLGTAVWTGARLAFVVDQMARLPGHLALPGLHDLERRLHRGAVAAPVGTADETSWFAARMMRLLALGDNASAIALEAQTGASKSDGYAARALALAHIGRGDRAAACAVPRPQRGTLGRRDTLAFFLQMLVYCQLLAGEFEKAGLTLELNEKTFGKDALYRDVAYLMAAQAPLSFGTQEDVAAAKAADTPPPLVLPDELTPMQIALLQLAGHALPEGVMNVPPYFMAGLAADYAQTPLMQLRAAHLAVRFAATPEVFSQVAQLADLSAYDSALPPPAQVPDAVFLAQALRLIDAAQPPQQARLVALYLRQAQHRGLWADMVRLLDDRLAALVVPQAPLQLPVADTDLGADTFVDVSANDAEAGTDGLVDELMGQNSDADRVADFEQAGEEAFNAAIDESAAAPLVLAPLPLAAADRVILMLAHMQAGHLGAAQNLMRLAPLHAELAQLARWHGIGLDMAGPVEDMPVAGLDKLIEARQGEAGDRRVATLLPAAAMAGDEALPSEPSHETPSHETLSNETPLLPALKAALLPDWAAFEARLAVAGPREALYLRRQAALYQALGVALAENLPENSLAMLKADLAVPLDDPLLQRLTRLADNKWLGDLVLAQIAELADKPAASYDAINTHYLIAGLRRAGLQAEAETLAAEILLSHTVALAVHAPHLLAHPPIASAFDLTPRTATPLPTMKPQPFAASLYEAQPDGGEVMNGR